MAFANPTIRGHPDGEHQAEPPQPKQPYAFEVAAAAVAAMLTGVIIIYPDLAFISATRGLRLWWEVVVPALLPFFIGSQVLMRLGVVQFLGVFLEPLMRPLFNVPGAGAFVLAMGITSGYPTGAILTARLRQEGVLSRAEAERLITFANTAGPLFMAGAVSVGMLRNPAVAGLIMFSHYLAAIMTGILFRFYGRYDRQQDQRRTASPASPRGPLLARALEAMLHVRDRENQPFGKLLGSAVRDSVQNLLLIGGFITLFSVITQVLASTGISSSLARVIAPLLAAVGIDTVTVPGMVNGLLEMTTGAQAISQTPASPLQKVTMISAVISFGGLCVLGQVAAVLQGTDISLRPYIVGRILQAVFSATLTVLLYDPAFHMAVIAPAAGAGILPATAPSTLTERAFGIRVEPGWLEPLAWAGLAFLATSAALAPLAWAVAVVRKISHERRISRPKLRADAGGRCSH